jgi:hypothetical protein
MKMVALTIWFFPSVQNRYFPFVYLVLRSFLPYHGHKERNFSDGLIARFPSNGSLRRTGFFSKTKLDFAERDKCKQVLLRLSLVGNLEKPLMSHYGNEWRERVFGLRLTYSAHWNLRSEQAHFSLMSSCIVRFSYIHKKAQIKLCTPIESHNVTLCDVYVMLRYVT